MTAQSVKRRLRRISPCPCPDHARVGGASTAARVGGCDARLPPGIKRASQRLSCAPECVRRAVPRRGQRELETRRRRALAAPLPAPRTNRWRRHRGARDGRDAWLIVALAMSTQSVIARRTAARPASALDQMRIAALATRTEIVIAFGKRERRAAAYESCGSVTLRGIAEIEEHRPESE